MNNDYYKEGLDFLEKGEYDKAVELFKKAAEQGDAEAQFQLAVCYRKGEVVKQDDEEAVKWLRKAAEQGNADAQFNLARCYYSGKGVEKDLKEAVKWFQKAAEQGNADAQFNLARCYYNGEGVEKNRKEEVKWLRKAAEQGDAEAQFNLGCCYYYGKGIERNYNKAFEWLEKAAEQGNADAQFNLAKYYFFGDGIERNYNKAFKWLKKAADQGLFTAQFVLAKCYYLGEGIEQNYKEAFNWFEKSLEDGFEHASFVLAKLFNDEIRTEQNYKEAFLWSKEILEKSHARAEYFLVRFYNRVDYLEQDYKEAYNWIEKAAKQGHALAQFYLATCYYYGEWVEQDYKEALNWFEKAAEKGCWHAQLALATCFFYGQGIKDLSKAQALIQRMADNNDEASVFLVGLFYYYGKIVKQDYKIIIELYTYVVEKGKNKFFIAYASYYLGCIYHYGYDQIEQDLKKAKKYYEKCIEHGYNCQYVLELVNNDIALEELYQEEIKKGEDTKSARKIARTRFYEKKNEGDKINTYRYAIELIKKHQMNNDREKQIEIDLSESFGGKIWNALKPNAQKSLVTAFLIYCTFLDLGEDYYSNVDFSPVINQLSKAFETVLREFFFKGYLRFLKNNKIDFREFVRAGRKRQLPIIKTDKDENGETIYSYQDEDGFEFTLGSFYYLIDSDIRSISDDQFFSRKIMGDQKSERTVNEHVLDYAYELFDDEKFSDINKRQEIVNYLIDLSTIIFTITEYRNPGAHEKTMGIDEATFTADYLIRIREIIKEFINKIKPQYLTEKGFFTEENE